MIKLTCSHCDREVTVDDKAKAALCWECTYNSVNGHPNTDSEIESTEQPE